MKLWKPNSQNRKLVQPSKETMNLCTPINTFFKRKNVPFFFLMNNHVFIEKKKWKNLWTYKKGGSYLKESPSIKQNKAKGTIKKIINRIPQRSIELGKGMSTSNKHLLMKEKKMKEKTKNKTDPRNWNINKIKLSFYNNQKIVLI